VCIGICIKISTMIRKYYYILYIISYHGTKRFICHQFEIRRHRSLRHVPRTHVERRLAVISTHENNMAAVNSCRTALLRISSACDRWEKRRATASTSTRFCLRLGWSRRAISAGQVASESGCAVRGRSHLPEFLLPWFRPRTEQGNTSLSLAAFLTTHTAPFHLPHLGPGHLCMSISHTFIVRVFSCVFSLSLLRLH